MRGRATAGALASGAEQRPDESAWSQRCAWARDRVRLHEVQRPAEAPPPPPTARAGWMGRSLVGGLLVLAGVLTALQFAPQAATQLRTAQLGGGGAAAPADCPPTPARLAPSPEACPGCPAVPACPPPADAAACPLPPPAAACPTCPAAPVCPPPPSAACPPPKAEEACPPLAPSAQVKQYPWDPRPGKTSVIFWGEGRPPPGLVFTEVQDTAGFEYNAGNEVWAHATRALVDPNTTHLVSFFELFDRELQPRTHPVDKKPRIDKLDPALLLLPVANMLWNAHDFANHEGIHNYTTKLTAHIRLVNKPVLLVGIGTQGDFVNVDPTKLKEEFVVPIHATQVEFLREVEKRAPGFAVRGRVTQASCLAKGLVKPRVLGCPSLFLNHDPSLGRAIAEKFAKVAGIPASDLKLAVTLPAITPLAGSYAKFNFYNNTVKLVAERILARFPNSFIVVQTYFDYQTIDAMCAWHKVCLPAYRVKFYYDVDAWVAGLQTADLVLGYRCVCLRAASWGCAMRVQCGIQQHMTRTPTLC